MWISSLVVTLSDDASSADAVLQALTSVPVFETGDAAGRRLPVVVEADDGSAARHWHRWVEDLPGVVSVDVAFVSFDDDTCSDGAAQLSHQESLITEMK